MNQAIFNFIIHESRQLENLSGEKGERYGQLYQHKVIFRRSDSEVWVNEDLLIRENLPNKVLITSRTTMKDDLQVSGK